MSTAKINVLEALNFTSAAWDCVHKNCTTKGFDKTDFLKSNDGNISAPTDYNETKEDCVV